MRDVDTEKIGTLVSSIRDSLSRLEDVRELSRTEFFGDRHKQDSAKYNFIVGIEAAIDVANHLISRKGFRAPEDYADTFRVLSEADILDKDFPQNLKKWPVSETGWSICTGKSISAKSGPFFKQNLEILTVSFENRSLFK